MKLQKMIELFITAKRGRGKKATTLAWYESILSSFARWVEGQPDPALTPELIDEYMAELYGRMSLRPPTRQDPARTGLRSSTVSGHDRALRTFFRWCVTREYLAVSPMEKIERPAKHNREPRAVQEEEYMALLDSIGLATWTDLRDRLIIETLYLSGVRVKELVELRINDFDLQQRLLIVHEGKNGDDEPVPLLPQVSKALALYMMARPSIGSDYVFLSNDGRGQAREAPITTSGVRQMLWRRWQAVGLTYRSPHKFRHGLARFLLNVTGADMALIQKILRHKRITTTAEIYAAWDMAEAQRQFEEKMTKLKRS